MTAALEEHLYEVLYPSSTEYDVFDELPVVGVVAVVISVAVNSFVGFLVDGVSERGVSVEAISPKNRDNPKSFDISSSLFAGVDAVLVMITSG